jgi:hypothetical protein
MGGQYAGDVYLPNCEAADPYVWGQSMKTVKIAAIVVVAYVGIIVAFE